ncbi:Transcription factor MYB3R-2 [Hondaea fermentalgiana]|uniref:Transcription factor MYB3R-2 n=1 Tax=Hondaea fermentalgiana TaxID=2315210 RepID=A0A2R5GBT4_9STRA|nr:Transcription factor MYB3R-2 [Hondaea fermentalgiana]|eukprot:GBG27799.1 Transcription factor MYB3R-2 [Hondaea fermentalgiana]
MLKKAVDTIGARNWKRISQEFLNGKRSDVQCLHRWQKVLKPGLIKGPWTKEEDDTIMEAIESGVTKWSEIATLIPGRIGKQCRERWFNHLDPSIKKGGWTEEEDRILVEYQEKLGNRWCEIAKVLPGRSENAVKNRWNSAMRRKFQQKRSKQGAAGVLSNIKLQHSNGPKQRNNVRLPPEAILVEQPTNRNSVIAAREKIKRHQELMKTSSPSPSAASTASGSGCSSVNGSKDRNAAGAPSGSAASNRISSNGVLAAAAAAAAAVKEDQAAAAAAAAASAPGPVPAGSANGSSGNKKKKKMPLQNRTNAKGENCKALSNSAAAAKKRAAPGSATSAGSMSSMGTTSATSPVSATTAASSSSTMSSSKKRQAPGINPGTEAGSLDMFGAENTDPDVAKATRPKKRAKNTNGTKHSKAVMNLLRYDAFVRELGKRKAFAKMTFDDAQRQSMHQEVLRFIEDANQSGTSLAVSAVWSHIQKSLAASAAEPHPLDDDFPLSLSPTASETRLKPRTKSGGISGGTVRGSRKSTGASNRPRDLRVQCNLACSINPCEWTLEGGTPTVLGQQNTPVSDMLNFIPSLPSINTCIFSPTPRGGHGCPTPLNALPTPTGVDMKKIDVSVFDDGLFGDNIFLEPLTLQSNPPVLSPILRQPVHQLLSSD